MEIQQASSSSAPCPPTLKNFKYEVFLSFRGEDTRKNFTDHLYFALKQKGINAFRDDENLQRGKTVREGLLQAIKDSRISVIIFSINYASSTWCLDELAQVHECMKNDAQIVLPIFYGVDPSEVRKQTGTYGKEIANHETAFRESGGKVAKWKTALTEVANQSGWDLKDRHEAEAIQEIVEDIFTKLRPNFWGASSGLVGIDSRLHELIARLCVEVDDVRMVGIWGMAGIGKTTLAKVVFEKLSSRFDGSSFLFDVREMDERHNLASLQKQLLNDVLGAKYIEVSSVQQGTVLISQSLRWRKVLVVLDDVNKWEQLESLAGSPDWFGPGSRVIFTTRDERLSLKYGVENKPYRIEGLNHKDSYKLFCTKAFDNEYPTEGFLELSNEVVTYCGGLPLALQVLGSFFRGRSVTEWHSALRRLKEIPDSDIMDKLQISFNGLKELEKNIFLDIACFFKGENKDYISAILESCGFYPDIGLSVLKEKSLITIDPNNYVSMHDLLQEMGREIVRQESPQEPGNRSRIWHCKDAFHVLEKNTGTNKVEGIMIDSHQIREGAFRRTTKGSKQVEGMVLNEYSQEVHRSISSKSFLNMKRLRLLRLPNLHCLQGREYLSNDLRYLGGNRYPFESLPSNLYLDKLVELHLSHSNIKQLWKRKQPPMRMLKVINLSHSQNLIKTPDFSTVPNLEELILQGCTRLHEVHQSIGMLERLVWLNLKDCKCLKELPSTLCDLKTLKNLILHGCPAVHKLPERLGDLTCLEVLDLGRDVANEQPPTRPWDFLLRPWQLLPWKHSSPVALTLPSLSTLRFLRDLNLSYCKLKEGAIPNDWGCFPLLESLDLSGNDFTRLPTSIDQLSKVHTVVLRKCKGLQSLPNLPSTVEYLYCGGCKSLETVPGSICGLSDLYRLDLSNCSSVKLLPDLPKKISLLCMNGCASLETLPNNISGLSELFTLRLDNCKSLRTLPDIPSSIEFLNITGFSSPKAPPDLSGTENQGVFGWLKKYLQSILKEKRQGLLSSPADKILRPIPKNKRQGHARNLRVWLCHTGGGIPGSGWFDYVNEGASLKVELPPYWFNNECLGFSIFVVLGFQDSAAKDSSVRAVFAIKMIVKAWITKENPISAPLYEKGRVFSAYTGLNSDLLFFISRNESKSADWWNSLSHLEASIADYDVDSPSDLKPNCSITDGTVKVKYIGLRIVYEQDVEELNRWSWTSSSPPFHNVVSKNKRSHEDDDGRSSDSQLETRLSFKRLKLEDDISSCNGSRHDCL